MSSSSKKPGAKAPASAPSAKAKITSTQTGRGGGVSTEAKNRSVARTAAPGGQNLSNPGPDRRGQLIAEAAYLRAEKRGFVGGDPVEDWLIAEREVDAILNSKKRTRVVS